MTHPFRLSQAKHECRHAGEDRISTQASWGELLLQPTAFRAKSLSDASRLKILRFLNRGPKSVAAIAEALDLSRPLALHHLKVLELSLLVTICRQGGPLVLYPLADPQILEGTQIRAEMATDLLTYQERK